MQTNTQKRPLRLLARIGLVGLLGLLAAPLAAQAQQNYSLIGAFARGEGVVVNLPVIGGGTPFQDALCNNIVNQERNFAGMQNTTPPVTGLPFAPLAQNGCIPGGPGPVAVNTAPARATFMVPTSFFGQPEDDIPNAILVPIPGIISLTTDASFFGPLAGGPQRPIQQQATVITTPPLAVWNQFREGAWTTQTGRAGLNFTWCPGNKNCTVVGQGQGAIVKYSQAPGETNGFGGTMSVVLAPGDVQGRLPIVNPAGGNYAPNSILINPVQAPVAQGGAGPGDLGGKGYAAVAPAMAGGGVIYANYQLSPGGFLTALTSTLFPVPGTTNTDQHMPFTTGMVLARNVLSTQGGNPNTFTFVATGYDNRTPSGEGNIQLVAGGLRRSTSSGNFTPNLTAMTLSFVPEPGALGLIAAGGLFVVGLARMRRS